MDMFDKASKVAKKVSDSAKTIGSNLYSTTKDQTEMASLNVQKSVIEKKLDSSYAKIGRRYVEYVAKCDTESVFTVDDLLEQMKPELEKLEEVKVKIAEKDQQIKLANEEKAQKKAQEEFALEKKKLDKALELEIIALNEYESKLAIAQRKLDHYDLLRKYELQFEMDIISKEEYEEKVKAVLQ